MFLRCCQTSSTRCDLINNPQQNHPPPHCLATVLLLVPSMIRDLSIIRNSDDHWHSTHAPSSLLLIMPHASIAHTSLIILFCTIITIINKQQCLPSCDHSLPVYTIGHWSPPHDQHHHRHCCTYSRCFSCCHDP